MRVLARWVVLPLLVLAAAPSRAEDELLRMPLTAAEIPAPRSAWYGLYLKDRKIGWVHEQSGLRGTGTGAVYVTETTGHLEMASMKQKVAMDLSERQEFDAASPFAFRSGHSSRTSAGSVTEVRISRGSEGAFKAEVTEAGATRALPVAAFDYTLADALTSERWVRAGRAVGDSMKSRRVELDEAKVGTQSVTIAARNEALVSGVKTLWYDVRAVSDEGVEVVNRVDSEGREISMKLGGAFEARLETEETAKKLDVTSDLFVFGMSKVNKPLGDPRKVRRLVLEARGEGAGAIPPALRQEVTRDPATGVVTLRIGEGVGVPAEATAKEIADALAETVECPCKLPEVVELAAKAVGDAATPREKVARLVKFVGDYVRDVETPRHVPVAEIITTKQGDCSEHSDLFTALARAAGIPAREVSGLMYMGDDVKAFGGHAWNEVVVDGKWVAVDPAWEQTELDAAHITLERDDKGMGRLGTLGWLSFELIEVDAAK